MSFNSNQKIKRFLGAYIELNLKYDINELAVWVGTSKSLIKNVSPIIKTDRKEYNLLNI